MIILGIETSCDETAISVIEARGGLENLSFKILGSAINSQIEIHREFGGVVPNLAKREHQKNLPIVLEEALSKAAKSLEIEAKSSKLQASSFPIDLIAVTVGPGLEPALWVGIEFAKELGKKWDIPVVGANHMIGHILSALINNKKINFPALALLISGGHTELVFLKNWLEKEKIGHTLDDAVGEAFDKVARMLGLPYPGGPEISRLAEEARLKNIHLDKKFPRPMIHSKDFNFSFSGLKTAVLYYIRKEDLENELSNLKKMAVAREFEDAIVETLISKTMTAIEENGPKTLIIGGGVIANKTLRENFLKLKEIYKEIDIFIPEKSLTTDNATMIAAAGYIEHLKNESRKELMAQGNLSV